MQLYGAVSVPAQVAASLRRKIYAGEYLPGTALPSAADLAAQYGHSKTLISEELVSAERGRGTFVLPRRVNQAVVEIPGPASRRLASSSGSTRTPGEAAFQKFCS
jgi:DNA-binding GntR family transcriptional regulator